MNLHPENNLVFSYGTLKRGFPNHSIMVKAKACYIADARTKFKYPLLQAGKWNAPFMIHSKNYPNSYKIKGELFEIDKKGMLALDEFEGVDKCYYKRLKTEIYYKTEKGHIISKIAWCYYCYENSANLLANSSRFIPFFGKEELHKYTPVHLRPSGWKDNIYKLT
ncbi:MAG: gamma-glutamylcyclotransferase family protein [Chitinophagales bacterium]